LTKREQGALGWGKCNGVSNQLPESNHITVLDFIFNPEGEKTTKYCAVMKKINYLIFAAVFVLVFPMFLPAQGNFEFGIHYSNWSLGFLEFLVEDAVSGVLKDGLKGNVVDSFLDTRPGLIELDYDQVVSFDSGDKNWGFEVRWYPKGQTGSLSLGLSVEKTEMRISLPELSTHLRLLDTGSGKTMDFTGNASGASFKVQPLSVLFLLRWDIVPQSRVRPFITFGFGAADTNAVLKNSLLDFSFSGTAIIEGEAPEEYAESLSKSLQEIKDEAEADGHNYFVPPLLPFLQLSLGLKGEITHNLYLLVETGIFNGFVLRGGISVRI